MLGKPYIREMPRITAVAGKDLIIKCPVAGYPIETITWEHGTDLHCRTYFKNYTSPKDNEYFPEAKRT